jgi:protein TonB
MNEKLIRLTIIIFTVILHLLIILFFTFDMQISFSQPAEFARVMKVTDFAELPPPPSLSDTEVQKTESIAETMIETDTPPVQEIISSGSFYVNAFEDYLPMHMVSVRPHFNEEAITSDLVYPPIALRSGIEGRVILELFVDRSGTVVLVTILREEPEGRGFGDAAVKAFMGRKGTPAYANGVPVSCRFRYPVTFRIR